MHHRPTSIHRHCFSDSDASVYSTRAPVLEHASTAPLLSEAPAHATCVDKIHCVPIYRLTWLRGNGRVFCPKRATSRAQRPHGTSVFGNRLVVETKDRRTQDTENAGYCSMGVHGDTGLQKVNLVQRYCNGRQGRP